MVTRPSEGVSRRARHRSSVVLPEPEGPTTQTTSPSATPSDTERSTATASKLLPRFSAAISHFAALSSVNASFPPLTPTVTELSCCERHYAMLLRPSDRPRNRRMAPSGPSADAARRWHDAADRDVVRRRVGPSRHSDGTNTKFQRMSEVDMDRLHAEFEAICNCGGRRAGTDSERQASRSPEGTGQGGDRSRYTRRDGSL